jgi:hypothetical protein
MENAVGALYEYRVLNLHEEDPEWRFWRPFFFYGLMWDVFGKIIQRERTNLREANWRRSQLFRQNGGEDAAGTLEAGRGPIFVRGDHIFYRDMVSHEKKGGRFYNGKSGSERVGGST